MCDQIFVTAMARASPTVVTRASGASIFRERVVIGAPRLSRDTTACAGGSSGRHDMEHVNKGYDYVIVGARLGRLRAGQPAERGRRGDACCCSKPAGATRHPFIHIPLGMGKMHEHDMFDWGYHTEPEPNLNGRRIEAMRGKVLGGSSSINVMAYTRGHRGDYDRWAQKGARGWSYADVLPYFKRCETWEGGENRVARRRRAGRHRIRQDRATRSTTPGSRPAKAAGIPRDRRLQRQAAGRLRPRPIHHPRRLPLVGRDRLSQAGAQAAPISRSRPARMRPA